VDGGGGCSGLLLSFKLLTTPNGGFPAPSRPEKTSFKSRVLKSIPAPSQGCISEGLFLLGLRRHETRDLKKAPEPRRRKSFTYGRGARRTPDVLFRARFLRSAGVWGLNFSLFPLDEMCLDSRVPRCVDERGWLSWGDKKPECASFREGEG